MNEVEDYSPENPDAFDKDKMFNSFTQSYQKNTLSKPNGKINQKNK